MKYVIPGALILLVTGLAFSDYSAPTVWQETNGRVFTNVGQKVELQARVVDDESNPNFVPYRNANSRAWSYDGDDWEVVWRRVGVPASEQVMATGLSSCKATERQSIYVRVRIEEPILATRVPTDPALEGGP